MLPIIGGGGGGTVLGPDVAKPPEPPGESVPIPYPNTGQVSGGGGPKKVAPSSQSSNGSSESSKSDNESSAGSSGSSESSSGSSESNSQSQSTGNHLDVDA